MVFYLQAWTIIALVCQKDFSLRIAIFSWRESDDKWELEMIGRHMRVYITAIVYFRVSRWEL